MNLAELKWLLARERLRIEEEHPPNAPRSRRTFQETLAAIVQEQPPTDDALPPAFAERWPAAVGPQLAQHARPVCLLNGVLHIYADHPGWLAEMKRLPKNHLLKKLHLMPGGAEIKELNFRLDPTLRTGRSAKKPA